MKYLCKTIYIMLILCVICTCVVGCATSDDMTTSDVPDEELTIFRCGDYYYNVDGWTDVMNFSSSNIDIPDGGCARIVADVTYMWGGVAGFNKDVGVNEIKEARLIDYEEAFPEGIKDYEWNAISGEDCLRKIMINNEWYYICLSYGDYAVYKDGERVATYTERDGKLYCEETGEYIVRDENSSSGYVTEQEENGDKREFHFLNADEVEGISDQDIMYIVEHDYDTSDFYSQEDYTYLDFDGIEMDGSQFEDYEIRMEALSVKPDNIDVPLSYTDMEDAAKNNIQEFIEAQNRYDNYGEQIEFTSDEDISFIGENDMYAAYILKYTDNWYTYDDPEGDSKTLDSEDRKYCWIYLKNLMRDEGTSDLIFLGQLNRENVCSVLDMYDYDNEIRNIDGAILLYRDIEENDNEFVYTSYIASGPGRGDVEGAVIYRNVYHVDKASHKLNIDKDCIKDIFY